MMMNKIAEKLVKDYPDLKIHTHAYIFTAEPPKVKLHRPSCRICAYPPPMRVSRPEPAARLEEAYGWGRHSGNGGRNRMQTCGSDVWILLYARVQRPGRHSRGRLSGACRHEGIQVHNRRFPVIRMILATGTSTAEKWVIAKLMWTEPGSGRPARGVHQAGVSRRAPINGEFYRLIRSPGRQDQHDVRELSQQRPEPVSGVSVKPGIEKRAGGCSKSAEGGDESDIAKT